MNMQDISDFIDLVKNPAKYEEALNALKTQQDKLTKVVETVGKVSEIDKIKKNLEVKVKVLEKTYSDKMQQLETTKAAELATVEKLKLELEDAIQKATTTFQEAVAKETAANEVVKSFAGRDKQLAKKEAEIESLRAELASRVSEYNEKIEKLKSVMV